MLDPAEDGLSDRLSVYGCPRGNTGVVKNSQR